ncbi:uncharacterized protein LOC135223014 [Macrobrachium nipponense]|uniref:uncharacterized protein LOC135223014 n=1 Tax=Macrobrachium nipponense TaxID=159736 RepID=UPI0030C8AAED
MEGRILSKRDNAKFSHNGYLFVFDQRSKKDTSIKFWRCENKNECKARIHTKNDEVTKELNHHSHGSSALSVEVAEIKTSLKRRAGESQDQPATIINSCTENVSQATLGALPKLDAMKQIVRRKRNKMDLAPSNPIRARELVIPEEYKNYVKNNGESENVLIADSGYEDERIMIFGRQSWTAFLLDSEVWYADGTFKLAPPLFAQVYVIMARRHGGVHPVLYALLPNKRHATYVRKFQMMSDEIPGLNPSRISCDFEQAAISAMEECFPGVVIQGCFFHLAHNVHKQLKQIGLRVLYNNDSEFALKAKMIVALCFMPIPHLDTYIDALSEDLPQELQSLINWFEDNYVGRPMRRGNGRRPPLFPSKMWNQYERTIAGLDRTNNHAEAALRRIYAELGVNHPVWSLSKDSLHYQWAPVVLEYGIGQYVETDSVDANN